MAELPGPPPRPLGPLLQPLGPPPEARLLRAARVAGGISLREAASRAGVSVSLWRQVEAGYITPAQGVHAPKVAPAATLARMAHAVALKAERLESEGKRADAAKILRDLRTLEPEGPGQGKTGLARAPTSPSSGPGDFRTTPEMARAMAPHLAVIKARVAVATAAYPGKTLMGSQVFPDSPVDAGTWDQLAVGGAPASDLTTAMAAVLVLVAERERAMGEANEREAG